jgi:sugar lactone lactonase YvrE
MKKRVAGILVVSAWALVVLLAACGGGGNSSGGGGTATGSNTGVFADSAVQGLHFASGILSGLTDNNGAFQYQRGETVRFSVGDILLGEATPKATMTPMDLVAGGTVSDNTVLKIVRFLMSLDIDSNAANGITIPASFDNAARGMSFDFATTSDAALNNAIAQITGGTTTIVTATEAQAHLIDTFINLSKLSYIDISNEFIFNNSYWPSGITWDGQYIWVSNYAQGSLTNIIYKYDKTTGQTKGSIASPSQWTKNLCFDGTYIWLTDYYSGGVKIMKISKSDGSIGSSFPAILSSPAHQPGGLAWDGQYLYYAESVNNPNTGLLGSTIYKIDPSTGNPLETVYTTDSYYIEGLAYKNNSLWFVSAVNTGDSISNKLVTISLSGTELSVMNLPLANIMGLTNADGGLWYVESNSRKLINIVP